MYKRILTIMILSLLLVFNPGTIAFADNDHHRYNNYGNELLAHGGCGRGYHRGHDRGHHRKWRGHHNRQRHHHREWNNYNYYEGNNYYGGGGYPYRSQYRRGYYDDFSGSLNLHFGF